MKIRHLLYCVLALGSFTLQSCDDFLNIQHGTNSLLNSTSIIPNLQIISSKRRYRIILWTFRTSDTAHEISPWTMSAYQIPFASA